MGTVGLGLLRSCAHLGPQLPAARGSGAAGALLALEHSWQPCHLPPGHAHSVLEMHVNNLSSPSLMLEFTAEERISLFLKTL